jgi:hypothetical protein
MATLAGVGSYGIVFHAKIARPQNKYDRKFAHNRCNRARQPARASERQQSYLMFTKINGRSVN